MKTIFGKAGLGFIFFVAAISVVLLATACSGPDDTTTGVNKAALIARIAEAEAKMQGVVVSTDGSDVYRDNFWVTQEFQTALENALEAARAVADDNAATQDEVDHALMILTMVLNNYVPVPGTNTIPDKTALNQAIIQAETKMQGVQVSTNGQDINEDRYWVTPAVQTALETALAAARTVSADANATQVQVNAALAALNEALENYVPARGVVPVVTITFVNTGGSNVASVTTAAGQPITAPAGVTRFVNIRQLYDAIVAAGTAVSPGQYNLTAAGLPTWYNQGTAWNFANNVTSNMTLTAQWGTTLTPFAAEATTAATITAAVNNSSADNPIVYVLPAGNTDIAAGADALGTMLNSTANVAFLALNGAEASITVTANANRLFWLEGSASVILGQYVTLLGNTIGRTNPLIHLTANSSFYMLDHAEIRNISGVAEAGIVAAVAGHSTFTMEGGLIHGTDITDNARKWIWIAVIVVTDYGRMIMEGGQIINNWQNDRIPPEDLNRGSVLPGRRVMGGDVFINAASQARPFHAPVFEISGTAEVDFVFAAGGHNPAFSPGFPTEPADARPHIFTIGSNWTGRIGNLIVGSTPTVSFCGWLNEAFVGGARGHTLTGQDINSIESILFYPVLIEDGGIAMADLAPRSDRRISNSGNNIGHWLLVQ